MQTIEAEQLEQMKERGEDFVLINVLPEEQFEQQHIPGSKNVPVSEDDFAKQVEQLAGSKGRKIVVYCASTECSASPQAASELEEAGFSNVIDFAGGMREWQETNHTVASGTR